MRVLHILNELKPSGTELMYVAAAGLWQAHGLQSEVLSTGAERGALAPRMAEVGFRIHHMPFRRSPRFVADVYRFLRRGRYDAVHIQTERACFWYALAAYLGGSRCLFRTVNNVFPFHGLLRLRRAWQRRILRRLGVCMIAISPSVRAAEARYFANPTELIPAWFDDAVYVPPTPDQRLEARRRFGIAPETVAFCSISGCWSYKNHEAIVQAMALLPRGLDIAYLHAGLEEAGGPERRLAAELGVRHRVRFLGVVPEILALLHASDIYVMPSLYEGFGCSAVEAMGAGLPAILSDVAGLRDFRETCPGIRWVDTTPPSIAAAMQEFICVPSLERRGIGRCLSRAVHSHYGLSQGALRYALLYRHQPAS
jgi:glycosyltransferase involved in cell wall biosynthesis